MKQISLKIWQLISMNFGRMKWIVPLAQFPKKTQQLQKQHKTDGI